MKTPCHLCPLRRLPAFEPMRPEEVEFMARIKVGELVVDPGTVILMEGATSPQLFTVLHGMGLRYKTLEDGRRQVVNFVFPGDLIGLQSALMGEMKHTIEASTAMTLCVFRRADIWQIFRDHSARAYALTWIAAAEEHFLGDALATIGQRDARERVAWALVRLYWRLETLGLARGGRVPLPFTQQNMADALGLSLVHTNKTLGRLRGAGLANWHQGVLEVPDTTALARAAVAETGPPPVRPLF